jgi:hypothetical protein
MILHLLAMHIYKSVREIKKYDLLLPMLSFLFVSLWKLIVLLLNVKSRQTDKLN